LVIQNSFWFIFIFLSHICFGDQDVEKIFLEIRDNITEFHFQRDIIASTWPARAQSTLDEIRSTPSLSEKIAVVHQALEEFNISHLHWIPKYGSTSQSLKKSLPRSNSLKIESIGHLKLPHQVDQKVLEGNILYLTWSAFTLKQVLQIKTWIQQASSETRAVILDLRHNPGGMSGLACAIAMEFCEKDYSLGHMKGVDIDIQFPVFAQRHAKPWPIVILINQDTASTAEILARGMQVEQRATLVGTQSRGMALPSLVKKLSDGSLLQIPVADFVDAKGEHLEGIGVSPDIVIKHNHHELSSTDLSQDPFIKTALSVLTQQRTGE
jgi:hypothetical protein